MITVTHECDKCGKSGDPENVRLSGVFVCCEPFYRDANNTSTARFKQHWCRHCCVKASLLPQVKRIKDPPPDDPPPTLEDFIRDIVREEIEVNDA